MTNPDLASRRVLLLGAETDAGRAIASALSEAGARLAVVGASIDAETAFAVQRLARKLAAEASQAIDAANEMAVRVMVRQVSKALGGLDLAVVVLGDTTTDGQVAALAKRFCSKEMNKRGGGAVAIVWPGTPMLLMPGDSPSATRVTNLSSAGRALEDVTRDVIAALAEPSQ